MYCISTLNSSAYENIRLSAFQVFTLNYGIIFSEIKQNIMTCLTVLEAIILKIRPNFKSLIIYKNILLRFVLHNELSY